MKVNLSSRDHEVAFQDRYTGFLKRPFLQQSVKIEARAVKGKRKSTTSKPEVDFQAFQR